MVSEDKTIFQTLNELKEIRIIMQPLPAKYVLAIDPDVIPCIPLVVKHRDNCWEISVAFDGLTGLILARETVPEFILIGSNLLGFDCFEVFRLLKSHPLTTYIPTVIVVNGFRDLNQIIGNSELKHTATRRWRR